MRRTILFAVAVAVAALTLAGCGGSPTATAPATSTVAVPSVASSATSASSLPPLAQPDNATVERVFGEMLQKQGFVPRLGTVRDAIEVAREACSLFDAGNSYPTIAAILTKDGMTTPEIGAFTGMATVAFCSKYASKVTH